MSYKKLAPFKVRPVRSPITMGRDQRAHDRGAQRASAKWSARVCRNLRLRTIGPPARIAMRKRRHINQMKRSLAGFVLVLGLALCSPAQTAHWTEKTAKDWYSQQPWLVGSNYIPSTAINELEMWQSSSFDPQRIDTELGWAESLGLNTMRVFLHDLLWQQDPEGFKKRLNIFLTIAQK